MDDYDIGPDHWTSEQVAERRRSLAELAGQVCDDDLPKLAHLHDMLDVIDGVNDGTSTSDEAAVAMREVHREALPNARLTWHAADPSQAGRGWSVHPADVTESHLEDVLPMIGPALGVVSAMCERVWVQTTGDPDVSMADESKTAITFGASSVGQVYFGMTSARECGEDPESVVVASVGLAIPVATARALRDDLNRAIQRADMLRKRHVATAKRRLVASLVEDRGMPESYAEAIAAAAEAAVETGMPQVVIGPDGVPSSVTVDPEGKLDYGMDTP